MASPKRRRWFQFGICTLLVATTASALMLVQVKRVADRRAFIVYLRDAGHIVQTLPNDPEAMELLRKRLPPGTLTPTVPFWRQWIGDEALFFVLPEGDFSEDEARFKALFPEGSIAHFPANF